MQEQAVDPLRGLRVDESDRGYLRDFADELQSSGYTLLSVRDYIRAGSHFCRWWRLRGCQLKEIEDQAIAQFARHSCRCQLFGRADQVPSRRYVARVRRFVSYLRDHGIVADSDVPAKTEAQDSLAEFRAWLLKHRGLSPNTVGGYEVLIQKILPSLGDDPAAYDAALVRRVFLDIVRPLSRTYAKSFVTALRSYLRFLAAEGMCQPHLDRAIPTIPEWKLSALPRYLDAEDLDRVLTSCDLNSADGLRDLAVLLLLARLGLRAGDIKAMRLDDLDLKAGRVRVRGKGRKEVCLPLPQDAGNALIAYLVDGRPKTDIERVFLCANAPIRSLATPTISSIVCRALKRAGITDAPSTGAHLLRHSAATAMLRSGASLDAVATVLRHESSDTTAHYAKVDVELLQQVAQPWPEGAPC